MKNHYFAFLLLFLIGAPGSFVFSQAKLYPIVFIATKDATIGKDLRATDNLVQRLIADIGDFAGMDVVQGYRFTGDQFNLQNLEETLSSINPQQEDIILFWYAGHGIMDNDGRTTPNLIFHPTGVRSDVERDQHAKNLGDIYDALKEKSGFVWVVGDACNNDPKKGLPDLKRIAEQYTAQSGNSKKRKALESNFRHLFQQQSVRLFQSSRRGRPTYTHPDKGALFSRAFLRVFSEAMDGKGIQNIDQFENEVFSEYESFLDQVEEEGTRSPGFFKRIVLFLFEGRESKSFRKKYNIDGNLKRALQEHSVHQLVSMLARIDAEEKERRDFLKLQPATYYITQAYAKEENAINLADSVNVAECYCTSAEIFRKGLNQDVEFKTLDKIRRYNRNHGDQLGLESSGGKYLPWLNDKCNGFKAYLKKEQSQETAKLSVLREERNTLQQSLNELRSKRNNLITEMETLEDRININQEVIRVTSQNFQNEKKEITYTIPKLHRSIQDMDCAKETIRKLENNIELTEPCELIYAQHVQVSNVSANADRSVNAFRSAKTTGYNLGEYCNESIRQAAHFYLVPLMESIRKVPEESRNQVKVELKVQGLADSRPCRGAGCAFKARETSTYVYTSQTGEAREFLTVKDRVLRINNEQLAMTRGLCAYDEAKNLLESAGIRDLAVAFETFISEDEGESERGVSIDYEVHNLFKHYQDEIENITKENDALRTELDIKNQEKILVEAEIHQVATEVEEVEGKIAQSVEKLFLINEQLGRLEEGGLYSNLIEILRAQGKTETEAKNFLGI